MQHRDRKPGESIHAWRTRKEREKREAHDRGDTVTAAAIGAALGSILGSSSHDDDSSSSSSSSFSDSSPSFGGGGGDFGGGGASGDF